MKNLFVLFTICLFAITICQAGIESENVVIEKMITITLDQVSEWNAPEFIPDEWGGAWIFRAKNNPNIIASCEMYESEEGFYCWYYLTQLNQLTGNEHAIAQTLTIYEDYADSFPAKIHNNTIQSSWGYHEIFIGGQKIEPPAPPVNVSNWSSPSTTTGRIRISYIAETIGEIQKP